jgi:pyridoxine 5-phosphate synthase
MKLGVNIDHVATLRQARYRSLGHGEPDPVAAARLAEAAGAEGITAHLREDRRHIQDEDVRRLRQSVATRFNLEMGNAPEMVELALDLKPDIVCLVPERRQELTTEGGLDAAGQAKALGETCRRMAARGIEVSLFIVPDPAHIQAAATMGAQCVEFHTGAFAEAFRGDGAADAEIERLAQAAELAHQAGLRVHAGHGLNYENLPLLDSVPHLVEVNIGHSIVSRAVMAGLEAAVRDMVALCRRYRGS